MATYEFKADKRGNRRFARVRTTRVASIPKGAVKIETAKPATVAKVDIDSGETIAVEPAFAPVVEAAAVSVPTTSAAKPAAKKKS